MKGNKKSFADRIRAAFKAKDAEAAEEIAKEAEAFDSDEEDEDENEKETAKTGDKATLDAILATLKSLDKRVADMEEKAEEKTEDDAEDEDEDEDKKETADDVLEAEEAEHNTEAAGKTYTGDATTWRDMLARAEILSPGIHMPTRDSKQKFSDALCACQRHALGKAYQSEDGRKAIAPFLFGRDLAKLTADQVAAAFVGASELMKQQNNSRGVRSGVTTQDFGRATRVSDINARNREYWAGRTGR